MTSKEPIVYDSVVNDCFVEESTTDPTAVSAYIGTGLGGLIRLHAAEDTGRATVRRDLGRRQAPRDPSWDCPRTARFVVDLQPPPKYADPQLPSEITDITAYFVTGDVIGGDPGFGFKLSMVDGSPTLQGVTHDGTTETAVPLNFRQSQLPDSGRLTLRVEYEPTPLTVGFYVDGRDVGDVNDDPLPDGAAAAERLFTASLEAHSDVRRAIDFDARVVQS